MFTKVMKVVCVGALMLMAFWQASAGAEIVLDILICVGALTVATQAVARPKYVWTTGFVLIAVLFNPIVPVGFSRNIFLVLDLACLFSQQWKNFDVDGLGMFRQEARLWTHGDTSREQSNLLGYCLRSAIAGNPT